MAVKTRLSRQYVYVPLTNLNFDITTATIHNMAFMSNPALEPEDTDWYEAIVVTEGHELYTASIGTSLALLIGPQRDEVVPTTIDLLGGVYLVWVDIGGVPGSLERYTDWAGSLEIYTGMSS